MGINPNMSRIPLLLRDHESEAEPRMSVNNKDILPPGFYPSALIIMLFIKIMLECIKYVCMFLGAQLDMWNKKILGNNYIASY